MQSRFGGCVSRLSAFRPSLGGGSPTGRRAGHSHGGARSCALRGFGECGARGARLPPDPAFSRRARARETAAGDVPRFSRFVSPDPPTRRAGRSSPVVALTRRHGAHHGAADLAPVPAAAGGAFLGLLHHGRRPDALRRRAQARFARRPEHVRLRERVPRRVRAAGAGGVRGADLARRRRGRGDAAGGRRDDRSGVFEPARRWVPRRAVHLGRGSHGGVPRQRRRAGE